MNSACEARVTPGVWPQSAANQPPRLRRWKQLQCAALYRPIPPPWRRLAFLAGDGTEILIERRIQGGRPIQLLCATIGNVSQPKASEKEACFFVRAELPNCSTGPRAVFLSGDAIRRYFCLLDGENQQTLYHLLQVLESASPADLRLAWRVRNLELGLTPANAAERSKLERALQHPSSYRLAQLL